MIKRTLAFVVDYIALKLLAMIWIVGNPFLVASVQFLVILLVVYLQHRLWEKTLGMRFFGLKIHWNSTTHLRNRLFVMIPFLVHYGISYLWAIGDYITIGEAAPHWLESGNRNVPLPGGILVVQTILILGFVTMILAPQFFGEKRMGWEIIAGCEIVDEYKKS